MTNGTVQKGSGTTLVVQYQDGSKTISVPANIAVTLVAPEKVTLAAGDTIYLTTNKLPDGTLTTNQIRIREASMWRRISESGYAATCQDCITTAAHLIGFTTT